jgi:hypothetical protein
MNIPAKGQKIRLLYMHDDPDPIPTGTEGLVLDVQHGLFGSKDVVLAVRWDNGRALNVVLPPDRVEIL